jgi:tRNA (mo5U34)-methyltransferase
MGGGKMQLVGLPQLEEWLSELSREEVLALAEKISWYHSIDLGGGFVTDGWFDLRNCLTQYGIPEDLSGKTVLDIGRSSGFFSFEFERRGASVVATELPSQLDKEFVGGNFTREVQRRMSQSGKSLDPSFCISDNPGERWDFHVARKLLDSKVIPFELKLSELSESTFDGKKFDVVFVGSILNHVTDPAGSLQRIFSVTRELCILANPYDPSNVSDDPVMHLVGRKASGLTTWWMPNKACLIEMMYCAGFENVKVVSTDFIIRGRGGKIPHLVLHAQVPQDLEKAIHVWKSLKLKQSEKILRQ